MGSYLYATEKLEIRVDLPSIMLSYLIATYRHTQNVHCSVELTFTAVATKIAIHVVRTGSADGQARFEAYVTIGWKLAHIIIVEKPQPAISHVA